MTAEEQTGMTFEMTTGDVELTLGYLVRHKLLTYLQLRKLDNSELCLLLGKHFRDALQEGVGKAKNRK